MQNLLQIEFDRMVTVKSTAHVLMASDPLAKLRVPEVVPPRIQKTRYHLGIRRADLVFSKLLDTLRDIRPNLGDSQV